MTVFRWVLVAVVALLLTGCGFHLQGAATVPPSLAGINVVAGSGPASGVVAEAVRRRLALDGVRPDPTGPRLVIDNAGISQRVTSISPSTGIALEFLSTLRADYRVEGSHGEPLLPGQQVMVENSFSFNSANPLATSEQQNQMNRELVDQAAQQILLRILNSPALRRS